jgi:aminomethyltransferase
VSSVTSVKRTPFHAFHVAAGARLIDFAGYEMPVRYTGDVREHEIVRKAVGLFDISHMGEFYVTGFDAVDWVNGLVTNDVNAITAGQALYTPMCREDGGIVDDVLVYRFADRLMVVVNAANRAKDWEWMESRRPASVTMVDRSDETALLAVQGPRAAEVLRGHVPEAVLGLGYYRFTEAPIFGVDAVISRTGYTGEDGFEIYFAPADAETVWIGLLETGRVHGLEPVGLGARDTLRLEMGFMLYGNDIDDTTSPLEAGIGWTVKLGKADFVGRDALRKQKEAGLERKLVGFELDGRRVPRHGMAIEAAGSPVGVVTSGTFGPSLHRPLGMGYVAKAASAAGATIDIVAGTQRLPARVTKPPFYTQGSRRTS